MSSDRDCISAPLFRLLGEVLLVVEGFEVIAAVSATRGGVTSRFGGLASRSRVNETATSTEVSVFDTDSTTTSVDRR